MGGCWEFAEDCGEVFGEGAVHFEALAEFGELGFLGEFAVPDEVGGLFEGGVGGKVFDVVASVEEFAAFAVYVADVSFFNNDVVEALVNRFRFGSLSIHL